MEVRGQVLMLVIVLHYVQDSVSYCSKWLMSGHLVTGRSLRLQMCTTRLAVRMWILGIQVSVLILV